MNNKIKSELPALIKETGDEILKKQREEARARIKPVLEYKEAMDKSIADCERDLEKARKIRDDFAAKLAEAEAGKFEALEDAEKIISENNPVHYWGTGRDARGYIGYDLGLTTARTYSIPTVTLT